MTKALLLMLVGWSLLAAVPALADEVRRERVQFTAGSSQSTLKSRIKGYDSVEYSLAAEAGQRLTVIFKPSSRMAYFNVLEPGNPEAIFVGDTAADPNRFQATLAKSGDTVVQVYQMRAGARRGEAFSYTITVRVDGKVALDAPPKADVADGLAGGPDAWEVAGLPAPDRLQVRKAPSPRAAAVTSVENGSVLRNKGCRIVSGQRWCQVESVGEPRFAGWAAARFLREGAAPAPRTTLPAGLDLAAACRRSAAVDFATRPDRIRTARTAPGPEGYLVDASADLGSQGVKPFACRFDAEGRYLGILSKVNEGAL